MLFIPPFFLTPPPFSHPTHPYPSHHAICTPPLPFVVFSSLSSPLPPAIFPFSSYKAQSPLHPTPAPPSPLSSSSLIFFLRPPQPLSFLPSMPTAPYPPHQALIHPPNTPLSPLPLSLLYPSTFMFVHPFALPSSLSLPSLASVIPAVLPLPHPSFSPCIPPFSPLVAPALFPPSPLYPLPLSPFLPHSPFISTPFCIPSIPPAHHPLLVSRFFSPFASVSLLLTFPTSAVFFSVTPAAFPLSLPPLLSTTISLLLSSPPPLTPLIFLPPLS